MYIVTFYSFKGGTGRSMALVNVAAELASRGRKVLIVDFDLEAPGLDTFRLKKPKSTYEGIVDFVLCYRKTRQVPDVKDYLYEAVTGSHSKIWVMSAGKQDRSYDDKFRSIDWQHLYDKEDGFLLFEDLKAQWKEYLNPDYVLIDSRTGHTDTGGICTRQLPDSVVVLFFPNEQNRRGLLNIVDQIRAEEHGPLKKTIKLHFVLANVPDLDDEDRILAAIVEKTKRTLQYDELAAVIHHYNSLALLNQVIFTSSRPRSRLATEYREIANAIVRGNLEDLEAAIAFLDDAINRVRSRDLRTTSMLEQQLEDIREKHPRSPDVLRRLAVVRRQQRKREEALALVNQAIDAGAQDSEIIVSRADLLVSLGDREAALRDLNSLLAMRDIEPFDLAIAIRSLRALGADVALALNESPSLTNLDPDLEVIHELQFSTATLPMAIQLLNKWVEEGDPESMDVGQNDQILCLIGIGRFKDAIEILTADTAMRDSGLEKAHIFNLVMARWGESGKLDEELMARFVKLHLDDPGRGANYFQCISIAFWAIHDHERAFAALHGARERSEYHAESVFSAWSYLMMSGEDFGRDLDEMYRLFSGQEILPRFIRRARGSEAGNVSGILPFS
jgi:MinD-like ATPase involved in chromosome partitioning or flagellar assembly